MKFMAGIDPTTVRLSPHFLLSDFIGNHSVYTKGLKNSFVDVNEAKLAEGRYLCTEILEKLLSMYGPLSISYGYISSAVSKEVVKYQDPAKPSYHRWDKGAAADVCIHGEVKYLPPVKVAHDIDENLGYSRMITYAESEYICIASQISEGTEYRRAFYENRYTGKKGAKPFYITKAAAPAARHKQGKLIPVNLPWRGAGYPTYHGGGTRQLHHRRISEFSVVSDFLYSTHATQNGIANVPSEAMMNEVFLDAGLFYDKLLYALDIPRVSIVRAFESFRFNDYPLFSWKDHFAIDCKPPNYITLDALVQAGWETDMLQSASVDNVQGIVRFVGKQE